LKKILFLFFLSFDNNRKSEKGVSGQADYFIKSFGKKILPLWFFSF